MEALAVWASNRKREPLSENPLLTAQWSSCVGEGAVSRVAGQGRFFFSPELHDSNWNVHLPLFLPLMLVGGLGWLSCWSYSVNRCDELTRNNTAWELALSSTFPFVHGLLNSGTVSVADFRCHVHDGHLLCTTFVDLVFPTVNIFRHTFHWRDISLCNTSIFHIAESSFLYFYYWEIFIYFIF